MVQRDYILRMIEQIGVILKALREMILNGSAGVGQVRAELQKVFQQIGFDIEVALIADTETLVRMIAPTGELEPGRAWLVAEAMYLDGLDAALDEQVPHARLSFEKAVRLFRMFDASTPVPAGFPEARERVSEIEERLANLNGDAAHDRT
jgi:hypothetical protein